MTKHDESRRAFLVGAVAGAAAGAGAVATAGLVSEQAVASPEAAQPLPDGAKQGAFLNAAFDDRYVNNYMGPNAQKHSFDEFNGGSNVAVATASLEGGPIASAMGLVPPPGTPTWGAAYCDFFAKYFARHLVLLSETENLPYTDQIIDLDPDVKDAWGLPAPRVTYDWRRPNETKQVDYMLPKLEELARAMGATHVWRAPLSGGQPGPHPQGGTRMGSDPRTSVVNKYSQSWDVPNLFIVGSSTNPSMSGFNPTLTIQALAYYTSDAIANRYRHRPGPLV